MFKQIQRNIDKNIATDDAYGLLYAFALSSLIANIFCYIFDGVIIKWLLIAGIIAYIILVIPYKKQEENKETLNENISIKPLYPNNTKPQKHTQTTQVYERNQELKNICINRAGFQCEIDNNHKSFISSKQHNYVEAHHIIPLSFQDKFTVNLDTLENLISLCPVCHKAIHQGNREEKLKVLKQIYNIRKPFNISFDDLLKLYLSN